MNRVYEEISVRQLASNEIDCAFRVILEFCECGRFDYVHIYSEKLDSTLRAFQISKIFDETEIAFLYRCINAIFDLDEYENFGEYL